MTRIPVGRSRPEKPPKAQARPSTRRAPRRRSSGPWRVIYAHSKDGYVPVKIDRADEMTVAGRSWTITTRGYPITHVDGVNVTMHNLILPPPPGLEVDHRNGDRLDNRRSNLRLVTFAQQQQNRRLNSNNTSGFRGVSRYTDGRWIAKATKDRRDHYLGIFDTAEEANEAVSAWRKLHMPFATG